MLIAKIVFFSALVSFVPFAAASSCNIGPVSLICSQQDVEASLQPDFGSSFMDVKFGAMEFWPYVKILAAKSIIEKSISFRPNDNATRAEALKMLIKSLDASSPDWRKIQTERPINSWFGDVQQSDWYFSYIHDALKYGFINSGKSFRPDDPITRQEFAKLAYYAMISIDPGKASKAENNFVAFKDDADIDSTISVMVYSLRANEIISGYSNGYFKPKENVKRAHIAKIIARTFFPDESGLRFSLGQNYKNVSDSQVADAFVDKFVGTDLKKGLFWTEEFWGKEETTKRVLKLALVTSATYLREFSGLDKKVAEEVIKTLYGDSFGLAGKVIVQITAKSGFWATVKSTFKSNWSGLVMIIFDQTLDTIASGARDELLKKGYTDKAQSVWIGLKLSQLSLDLTVGAIAGGASGGGTTGAVLGAIGASTGFAVDALWEDAKLTAELMDATFEATRSARMADCQIQFNKTVDDYIAEFKGSKSTVPPKESDALSQKIAWEVKECLDPKNQIIFHFTDSDKDAYATMYVRRFLKETTKLAIFQQCILSGQSQCGY